MTSGPSGSAIDYDKLEGYLKVLAYANRLELLALLRKPRTLDEISLTPGSSQAAGNPDRPISRQAVQNHLDKLEEAGLVRIGTTDRKGRRSVQEFVVDHARLFAVVEELRKISTFESLVPLDPFATMNLAADEADAWDDGPKTVLVHGVKEGKAFPLRHKDLKPPRGWILGRAADAHVSLEYDPYVSAENAEIIKEQNRFKLLDLRTAKNGTFLNWRRLPPGGETPLRTGDVIGVGRSLLVFRED